MAENKPRKRRSPPAPDDDPRAALAEAFFAAFLADWQEDGNGGKAIMAMRTDKPSDYVKLAAALLPKEFAPRDEPLDELTDAEIAARIAQLIGSEAAAPHRGGEAAGDEEAA
jgi:hypothetical protein